MIVASLKMHELEAWYFIVLKDCGLTVSYTFESPKSCKNSFEMCKLHGAV